MKEMFMSEYAVCSHKYKRNRSTCYNPEKTVYSNMYLDISENHGFPQIQGKVNITIQKDCEASSNTVQKSLNFQFLKMSNS
jgi:virulence-associated protein VapD